MIRQRTQGGVDLILSYPLIDRYLLGGVLDLVPVRDWPLAHAWCNYCPCGMTRIEKFMRNNRAMTLWSKTQGLLFEASNYIMTNLEDKKWRGQRVQSPQSVY
jgi:hypothetical protein